MADQVAGFLSPFLRKIRIKQALPYIRVPILDFGCGVGVLAGQVGQDRYVGVDTDEEVLKQAVATYPLATFYPTQEFSAIPTKFLSITLLAVIEHLDDPHIVFRQLYDMLDSDGVIIVTTPHPQWMWLHGMMALVGLCSKEARDDHKQCIDYGYMEKLCDDLRMELVVCRRFLWGMNQLFVLKKREK